jgi:hypothetical protein
MVLRKQGVPSGKGLALRMPVRRTGMPRSAQKMADFENRAMLRPGR